MERVALLIDICIVCALPEEARAFLAVVQQQSIGALEERISPRYHSSYRFAMLKNDKDEHLSLHISWLPRYGPQEMTLHLSRVLEEYQPRIVIMTGICAGDPEQVQLGDLVVAERTFTYDNGKFTLDEQGRGVHLYDTMTYQLDANILQFLELFDDWKPPVAGLQRPPSSSEQHDIACHLKAMASGSAVRADNPFKDVRAPVRGTVAIDMEGAAFGLVMSRHPLIRWLVVKSVCDYADQKKSDAYHDYAARASALYALSFLRAYVTNERLPRPDGPPSGRAGSSGVWNVPYRRNPHFTGRDVLLDRLHQQLRPAEQNAPAKIGSVALTQHQAIKGLGGIGKTQIAVEYAYRSRGLGRYMHTLWINGATKETIITSFRKIAELLPSFSAKDETDQQKLMEAIKRWLEQCEQPWLLIFDNADADDLSFVQSYFPERGLGSILLTTRADAVGSIAASIEVEKMGFMEGSCFLLRRAYGLVDLSTEEVFEHVSDEKVNEAGNIVVALDHFPLALDQAGAYIEETQCSFKEYLGLYQTHRQKLLAERGTPATDYPDSVATTWSLSFQKVQQKSPAAAELLQLCAFLAPDRIPEELITNGAAYWPPLLQQAATDPFAFKQMGKELLKYSLVKRLVEDRMLSLHRLVQAVQMDRMESEVQRQWAERVICAVNAVFPTNPKEEITTWPQCLRYLEQVQVCDTLIQQHLFVFPQAANLLNRTGVYLSEHASYTIAEPLFRRSLHIYEQLGPDHPVAWTLNNLAELYREQGKYAEAEPLHQRALRIREQQLGPEHPWVAEPLNGLALLYYQQDKYAEAEPLYKRALAIREKALEPLHPDTTSSLINLAVLYESQGRYTEAEPLFQRALAICERVLGRDHHRTQTVRKHYATLLRTLGRDGEASMLEGGS
jgi:tetratricopeptide (TPR) repeat protein/nucleoside phosphorylase